MAVVIPLIDLRREYGQIRSEIERAVARVLQSGWFVAGDEGRLFESEWAAYCGVPHAVGVGSGSDAVHLALCAAGIGPGDEVIVPALAPASIALGVVAAGATLVWADIDGSRYTLDPAAFESAITPSTAAVVPVHLYGCPADMERILQIARSRGLFVLEGAAHAAGACCDGRRVGGLADAAAFSFYPTRNLGAYGEAGAVTTSDAGLAERVTLLRNGGRGQEYDYVVAGMSSRMDEIQAAVLRIKMARLERWNEQRRLLAAGYETGFETLGELVLPAAPADVEHAYNLYVVRTPLRNALRDYLAGAGVGSGVQYPTALHRQPAFDEGTCSCPNAEQVAAEVLSLPIFPQISLAEVQQVVRLVRFFFAMREVESSK
ncbi:MAG: DegT/DnrJ/EryC1/StrS family aminotransferase [Anaerolineae bacterium]|nr:DegT/DnrJ/EryC1/StrS family aminotransferase [Anaerolineae bacterium]